MVNSQVESLGKLKYVGGTLYVEKSKVKSFGELKYVGGDLYLYGTLLSKMYSKDEIRKMIDVGDRIIM
jgi:hypothetical protein